ncbi:hypothetical protein ACLOJK_000726 [Asimina triloba]
MSVAAVPPNNESETEIQNEDNTSSPNGINQSSSASPLLCVARFAGDSVAGALMGSVFGYGWLTALFLHLNPLLIWGCFCACRGLRAVRGLYLGLWVWRNVFGLGCLELQFFVLLYLTLALMANCCHVLV